MKSIYLYLIASCILVYVPVAFGQEFKDVETAQGPVRGYKDAMGPFAFYGIPYATPPTGIDKFKAPLPPLSWNETFEAVDRNIMCPQVLNGGQNAEDCLVANIFTPETSETNLPVYFIIHGGGFETGHGNQDTPKAFVKSKKVVAVTFNYRLGVHGFLCLGTDSAPGNAALKDIVAALKWVKDNIANFGGDKENITVGGDSAGGTAVDLLMLSKSAEGLFNKAIGESVWSHYQDPIDAAVEQARALNFNKTNIEDLEDFYTTTDLSKLLSDDRNFNYCVEKEQEGAFLDKAPIDIIKANEYLKVPVLYSFCDKEGLNKMNIFPEQSVIMNNDFSEVLPKELDFKTEETKQEVGKKVKEFYFGEKPVGTDTVKDYINFISDWSFIYPVIRSVKLHVEAGHEQVYLYEYSFPTEHTVLGDIQIVGSTHTAQTKAIFDEDEDIISEEYKLTKEMLRHVYYTFITTGAPVSSENTFNWPQVNSTSEIPLVNINTDLTMQDNLGDLEDRIKLWDEVYGEYYKAPEAPSLTPTSASSKLLVTDLLLFVSGYVIVKTL